MITNQWLDQVLTILICVILPTILVLIAAILGTRARLKDAEQMNERARTGAYKSWAYPPTSNKIRFLVFLSLFALLMIIMTVAGMLLAPTVITSGMGFVLVIVWIILAGIAGGLLYRTSLRGK